MSELAAMILLSSSRSCGTDGRKTESLTYPHKKNRVILYHAMLVASEAAPGLMCSFLLSFVIPSVWANADWSSRGRGCGNVAEPLRAGKWSHHCHLHIAALTIPVSYQDRTCQWFVSANKNIPYNVLLEMAQKTFSFGESEMCSTAACGFSVSHKRTLVYSPSHGGEK